VPTLIVHEWLSPHGGSENVFEVLRSVVPDADTACLWNDAPSRFQDIDVETWLARTPLRRSKAASLPFMHAAWDRLPIDGYDRVLVSSHAMAHHVASRAARGGAAAFVYAHTPARYLWNPDLDARGAGPFARLLSSPLKSMDRRNTSSEVQYAANSEFVSRRVSTTWGQDAKVIYPPVEVDYIQQGTDHDHLSASDLDLLDSLPQTFVLGASRLVGYKRLDKVIELSQALRVPAVIAGSGPDEGGLRSMAATLGTETFFVGRVSTPVLHELFRRASLFVFLAVEDFGIMPVEAMAAGTPVLVSSVGGAKESVEHTGGGVVVNPITPVDRLSEAATEAMDIDMAKPRQMTGRFSSAAFRKQIADWIAP
jgi:glycosyltransferase involved in cell wall biosynthesis